MITSNIPTVIAWLRKVPGVTGAVRSAVAGKVAGADLLTHLRRVADTTLRAQWGPERDLARRAFYEALHPRILATLMQLPLADGVVFTLSTPAGGLQTSARVAAGAGFAGAATPLFKAAHPQFELLDPEWQRRELGDTLREVLGGYQVTHTPETGTGGGAPRRNLTVVRSGDFQGRNMESLIEELKPHWEVLHNAILQWVTQVKDTAAKDKYHTTKDGRTASDEDIARNLEYILGLRGGGGLSPNREAAAEALLPHIVNFLLNDPELSQALGRPADGADGAAPPEAGASAVMRLDPATARDWLAAVLVAWVAEVKILLRHRVRLTVREYFQNLSAAQPRLL